MRLVPVLLLLAAAALAAPCEDPAHRQFDFWLGEWEVRTPDGSVRQHWESAGADGAWTTVFDGLYTKAAE